MQSIDCYSSSYLDFQNKNTASTVKHQSKIAVKKYSFDQKSITDSTITTNKLNVLEDKRKSFQNQTLNN